MLTLNAWIFAKRRKTIIPVKMKYMQAVLFRVGRVQTTKYLGYKLQNTKG